MSSWRPNLHSGFELCENGAILSKRYQNMGLLCLADISEQMVKYSSRWGIYPLTTPIKVCRPPRNDSVSESSEVAWQKHNIAEA